MKKRKRIVKLKKAERRKKERLRAFKEVSEKYESRELRPERKRATYRQIGQESETAGDRKM